MKIKSNDWLFVTGKADAGKTFFIKAHIRGIPRQRLHIFDYNANDYGEFVHGNEPIVYLNRSGLPSEVDAFLNYCYNEGNCFVVLEEADNYLLNPSTTATRFVNTARNRNIGAAVNAKRATAIKPVFRTRFNYLIMFKTDLPEDRRYLESWTGQEKFSLDFLSELQQGEYVVFDMQNQKLSGIMRL